jgi:segregation and condensation protein B
VQTSEIALPALIDPATLPAPPHEPTTQARRAVATARRLAVSIDHLAMKVEALLFVASTPVSTGALARLLGVEVRDVREALEALRLGCAARGVEPVEVAGGVQLRTKAEHGDLLRQFLQAKPSRLSRAALETLAIVAYRQPITRVEVEDVRGVDSGAVLRGLLERRLVRILGRKEEPGRPILYGTTPTFLELFGIKSLRELPTLREFVELSEEHQHMVDRDAPAKVEASRQEVADYLADLEIAGADDEAEIEAALDADADDDGDGGSEASHDLGAPSEDVETRQAGELADEDDEDDESDEGDEDDEDDEDDLLDPLDDDLDTD